MVKSLKLLLLSPVVLVSLAGCPNDGPQAPPTDPPPTQPAQPQR